MFYEIDIPKPKAGLKQISALVVLNPAESRRLLAKAAVACSVVKNAWENGTIIIARGITNAFVTEELFDIKIESKAAQTVGQVAGGILNAHLGPPPCTWHVIRKGKVVENADSNVEILKFGPEDVVIKGANAIDPQGIPGIHVAGMKGGTIGMVWPIVTPRGSHLLIPVGLEKLVPSVLDAAKQTGIFHFTYSTGLPVKLIPVPLATVITEIEAFAILAGVKAYHVGSGGVAGSEGAVHLTLTGDEESVEKAFELVKSIKGEPAVGLPENLVIASAEEYKYDASAQLATLGGL
ncbi:MAG: hypothetical protein V3S66_02160 [Desulfobacterales bacterium]